MISARAGPGARPFHIIYKVSYNNPSARINNSSGRIIISGTIFGAIYARIYCTICGTINLTIHHYGFHNSGAGVVEYILSHMVPNMVLEIITLPEEW